MISNFKLRRTGTSNGRKGTTNINQPQPPNTTNHLATTDYATRCKQILELRADVHSLDTDLDIQLDFPRLVVIGDQSSGKSSLVEAVSGINVPRDSGTCTRCPMECIIRSTTENRWSCSISLQYKQFNDEGSFVDGHIASTIPSSFGDPIYDRSSVELWIRRAQAAVLSPHRRPTDFLNKTEHQLKNEADPRRLQFSNNIVRIEIKDPLSPDLDFVDLPGIVHAVEPPSLEDDVIELVESFIKSENTLILIAMPMSSDPQTQTAVRLAKTADPDGDRTIGILTKPDTLQDGDIGSREMWKKMLANEDPDCKTTHGYYCVRLPNDFERTGGITRAKAQNIAEEFFNSCAPWNQMEDKSRCGIPNFVTNISALLVERIEKYLPALGEKLDHLLDVCLKDIAELPPALLKTPSTEILLRISAFCQAFKDAVFGRDHRHFVQKNKLRYARFSLEVSLTKPRYMEEDVGHHTAGTGPRLSLAEVRRVKEGTITWELPPHVPFDATVILVKMYTSMWEDPSVKCFDDIVTNAIRLEETLLRDHFGQYGVLLNFVRQLTSQERDRCRDEARKVLKKIIQFESQPLFTQNEEFISSERNKWLEKHEDKYNRRRYEQSYKEFELMADSYAYFQVAHKRIIDYVPLTIEHELNQAFARNLHNLLFSNITRESAIPGRLEELVREDPALEKRRQSLETRRQQLLNIKQKLNTFWSSSNIPAPSRSSGSNSRQTRRLSQNSVACPVDHSPDW